MPGAGASPTNPLTPSPSSISNVDRHPRPSKRRHFCFQPKCQYSIPPAALRLAPLLCSSCREPSKGPGAALRLARSAPSQGPTLVSPLGERDLRPSGPRGAAGVAWPGRLGAPGYRRSSTSEVVESLTTFAQHTLESYLCCCNSTIKIALLQAYTI